ncbi:MAG: maltose ABC transporter substrate-binding protein [Actinobacteria bacterium]|uniref:sugar ABC transporter substrate-binding protein n=1 Tax=Propionicimonas sp. T2.31MG-18 TaxID=3157620 RepID=UPI0035E60019|nr:maltose ABC transporter substrate-binding protein [Actinomycetota bacterium]MCA0306822.1 maltose ABC transporter substrate-binding protein [Actinomycetota bacterium]
MRRSIVSLGVVTAIVALSACSTTPAAPSSSAPASPASSAAADYSGTTLTVWVDDTRLAATQAAAKAFETATKAKVELVKKNFADIQADFTSQVPTGKGPDVTIGAHDWLGNLIQNGVVAPIELGDKAGEFAPVAIQAFTQDGQVYGVPYAIENIGLIRNTKLAPEAPATWDDALAAGKKAGTKYPILLQLGTTGDPYTAYPLQTSFGAPVFTQNADGSYTSELAMGGANGEKFAQWLADQGKSGVLDTAITYDIAVDAFAKGKSPFIIGGPWMLEKFKGLDLAIDAIPSAGGQKASPFVGVQGFFISSKSANPIVANDFLTNYIATTDVQYSMYEAGQRTPALTSAAEKAAGDTLTAGFAKVAADAVPMPSIPEMASVWTFWGVTEANIVSGKQQPVAGWQKMISDIQAKIKK